MSISHTSTSNKMLLVSYNITICISTHLPLDVLTKFQQFFFLHYVKACAIPCPCQPSIRGGNTILLVKMVLPPTAYCLLCRHVSLCDFLCNCKLDFQHVKSICFWSVTKTECTLNSTRILKYLILLPHQANLKLCQSEMW